MKMDVATPKRLQQAAKHLTAHDPILKPVIVAAGPCTLKPHHDYYQTLCDSIIGQQLSVKAADAITKRFRDLFGGVFPSPEAILTKPPESLRAIGFSRAKVTYVHDLARQIIDGRVRFDKLDSMSNEAIIAELTMVKGIGEWTAHMFLMFCMGRLDVLAVGDLGIRSGVRALYQLPTLPNPQQIIEIADINHWHPYASVACWYIWHFRDNAPTAAKAS